jgi:hypothetical protein
LEQQPLKNADLSNLRFAGFSLKTARAFGSSLFQNRAPGCAGNVGAQPISFGTASGIKKYTLDISPLSRYKVKP